MRSLDLSLMVKLPNIFFSLLLGSMIACTVAKVPTSFKTPEDTFRTWRQAVEDLDFETLLACYATGTRPGVRKDIEQTSAEGLRAMQDETKRTQFRIEKVVYEKDRAFLRAVRRVKEDEEVEVLSMVKEGPDWKLLP